MKKLGIALILIIGVSLAFFSQDSTNEVIEIKKGQEALYDGVLVPFEEYSKMYDSYILNKDLQALIINLKFQISTNRELLIIKDEKIAFLQTKYELEKNMRIDIEKKLQKSTLKIQILTITTATGLSISLAELLGIGVVAILYNALPK